MEKILYSRHGVPVFQNKVYPTIELAKKAKIADIKLVQCQQTGLVFNSIFKQSLLTYDSSYNNEQSYSSAFKNHLNQALQIMRYNFGPAKIGLEIGCGTGYFLDMLTEAGFDVVGYDPVYNGSNSKIIKEYFDYSLHKKPFDFVILRHVLEHIPNPWEFLGKLSKNANHDTLIYIEVPCFSWIMANQAFYDICYEHVNYFTLEMLQNVFSEVKISGKLFGNQYLYVIAKLNSFNKPHGYNNIIYNPLKLDSVIDVVLKKRRWSNKPSFVWGAGAKGVMFTNYCIEKGINFKQIIDINPSKQNCYIGKSALKVISPNDAKLDENDIFVMNANYLQEIQQMIEDQKANLIPLT